MRPTTLVAVVLLAACANPGRDLAQCKIVAGGTTDVLARCLVTQHDWDPEEAMREGLTYDAGLRAEARRLEAEAAQHADSVGRAYQQHVRAQNAALRTCIARLMLAYYRHENGVPVPQGDESPLAAIIRTCNARYPDADGYGGLTPGFFDSLTVIAKDSSARRR